VLVNTFPKQPILPSLVSICRPRGNDIARPRFAQPDRMGALPHANARAFRRARLLDLTPAPSRQQLTSGPVSCAPSVPLVLVKIRSCEYKSALGLPASPTCSDHHHHPPRASPSKCPQPLAPTHSTTCPPPLTSGPWRPRPPPRRPCRQRDLPRPP